MNGIASLQDNMGVSFENASLLQQALVHSSYLNENPGFHLASNERLEFLGDSLVGFVIAERLYRDCPDMSEGKLTRLRASLVCGEMLARLANSLSLGDHLLLGLGEEASGGRTRQSNLAGVLEAVLGAVLLDQGFDVARELVHRLFDADLREAIRGNVAVDYKSRLQELVQGRLQITPVYRTAKEMGPDHDKEFTVEVLVGESVIGRGFGKNKRQAEVQAAQQALEKLTRGQSPPDLPCVDSMGQEA